MNFIKKYNDFLKKANDDRIKLEMIKIESESIRPLLTVIESREYFLKEKEAELAARKSYCDLLKISDKIRNYSTISFEDIYDLLLPLLYDKTGNEYEFVNEFYATRQWVYIKRKGYVVNGIADIVNGTEKDVIILKSYAPIYKHVDEITFFDKNTNTGEIEFLDNTNYDVDNEILNVLRNFMFEFVNYQIEENLYDKELSLLQFYEMYDKDEDFYDYDYDDYHGRKKRKKEKKRTSDHSFKIRGFDLKLKKELKNRGVV